MIVESVVVVVTMVRMLRGRGRVWHNWRVPGGVLGGPFVCVWFVSALTCTKGGYFSGDFVIFGRRVVWYICDFFVKVEGIKMLERAKMFRKWHNTTQMLLVMLDCRTRRTALVVLDRSSVNCHSTPLHWFADQVVRRQNSIALFSSWCQWGLSLRNSCLVLLLLCLELLGFMRVIFR